MLRTGGNITVDRNGITTNYEDLAANTNPGKARHVPYASFSSKGYGPAPTVTVWREDGKELIHLVTNMSHPWQAYECHCKRYRIENFSGQKSGGFHVHKSHLSDPERIARLMVAANPAHFLVIFLRAYASNSGYHPIIHCTDRSDLSLFQLGPYLADCLPNRDIPMPMTFDTLAQLD